jgi:hypothetical protein
MHDCVAASGVNSPGCISPTEVRCISEDWYRSGFYECATGINFGVDGFASTTSVRRDTWSDLELVHPYTVFAAPMEH